MRSLSRIGWGAALALASAYCVVEGVLGIATGFIDGPVRGRDYISATDNPGLFWATASMHLLIAILAGATAYKLLTSRPGDKPA